MENDPMTLIERLRNPAWHGSGMTRGMPAELNVKQTVADMAEAADEIARLRGEIEYLKSELPAEYRKK